MKKKYYWHYEYICCPVCGGVEIVRTMVYNKKHKGRYKETVYCGCMDKG